MSHSNISQLNETPSPNENDPDVPLDWSIVLTLKTLLVYGLLSTTLKYHWFNSLYGQQTDLSTTTLLFILLDVLISWVCPG